MSLESRIERLERPHNEPCPHGYDLRDDTQEKDMRPPVVCEVCGQIKRVVRLVNAGEN
jgi:hypothetical protein